ncbi:MAG: tetratricopeptide repeat protein, partial [Planctomycetaceae bacterium]|nr:tetratricopeptide repeat protein [Planctomycetaceae bacterium]
SNQIDPANTEALSWYMAGLLAQKRGNMQEAADAFEKSAEAAPGVASPRKALALVLLRMGRNEEGIRKAQEAIELDPNDYETRLQLAMFLVSARQPVRAVQMIDSALTSKTLKHDSREFVSLHQVRARLLLALRNMKGAADSYEILLKALERPEDFGLSFREHQSLLKDRASSYEAAGAVLMDAGRTDLAIEAFEALNRIEKNQPGQHHLLLARAYFMKDKLDECQKNLDTYFKTGGRVDESIVLLKDLYEATSRTDELIPQLEKLMDGANDPTALRMAIAQVMLDRGEIDKAADTYQALLDNTGEVAAYQGLMRIEVIRRNADTLIATMNRAVRARLQLVEILPLVPVVLESQPFAKQVVESCQRIRTEKPNSLPPQVLYFCSRVAKDAELSDDEGDLLKATLEGNPEPALIVQALEEYGFYLLIAEKYAESARTYTQLVQLPGLNNGKKLEGLYRLSQAHAFDDNHEAALEAIRLAVSLSQNQIPLLRYQLGWVLAQAEQFEEAERVLQSCLQDFAQDAETVLRSRSTLAGIYSQQGRWKEAVQQYKDLIEDEKTDPDTRRRLKMGLSNALVQSGELDEGEKILEEVYEEDPTDVGVNNDLGYLYADHNKNLEKAEKMIRLAVESQPDNPAYLDSLGWVLFRLGRHEEALAELQKAVSDPDYQDSTILEHMGDVLDTMGKKEEALDAWKRALKAEQDASRPDPKIVERIQNKIDGEPGKPGVEAASESSSAPAN